MDITDRKELKRVTYKLFINSQLAPELHMYIDLTNHKQHTIDSEY